VIRCFFRKKETQSTETFEEFGPLMERLDASLKAQDEEVVLRIPDDESFFDVGLYRAATQAKAESAVQTIVGSSAPFWGQNLVAPDGEGWRLVWTPMRMNSQQQQVPAQPAKNGRR
jgi:hypothetical protein